jgi:hypothetical protein
MGLRERTIERPASTTCGWPLSHPDYQAWLTRSNVGEHRGLLRLLGHPGSGKSVLMKALAAECAVNAKCPQTHIATFFFDASGTSSDQKSMLGLLKALLFQLLPICPKTCDYFNSVYAIRGGGANKAKWTVEELKDILLEFARAKRDEPVYIFVDAVDECERAEGDKTSARSVTIFLGTLAITAYNTRSNLNVCMASRRYPTVSMRYCAEISVDTQNHEDIERYVSLELDQYVLWPSTKFKIKNTLTSKAGGVFLWARLVLSSIAQSFDDGLSLDPQSVFAYLKELPQELHELFDRILGKISTLERLHALRVFQWAVFAQRPLSVPEWIHILAFVDKPELHSIAEWSTSKYGVHDIQQLAKRLRSMTGGLLEVTSQRPSSESSHGGAASSKRSLSLVSKGSAVAGSMEPSGQDKPGVQFIHVSASQYLVTGRGFERLGPDPWPTCIGSGHLYIAETCLRYCHLNEMAPLISNSGPSVVKRSDKRLTKHQNTSGTNLSVASFGSSAASSSRRSSLPTSEVDTGTSKATVLDETISEPRSWFLSAWLEMMSRESGSIAPTSSASNAHTEPPLVSNALGRSVNSGGSSLLDDPSDDMSARETHVLLSEDPLLRLYAIETFTHHATEANNLEADPSQLLGLVERDEDSDLHTGCWHKWCQINDGIQSDTTPAYFATECNLETWIVWFGRSPSHQTMLSRKGGSLQYPLLAAIFWSHDSILAYLSDHIDENIDASDIWTLLYSVAAQTLKTDTTVARRRFNFDVIEMMTDLNRVHAPEPGLWVLFRRFRDQSNLGRLQLYSLLHNIQHLKHDPNILFMEPSSEDMVRSFVGGALRSTLTGLRSQC